MLSGHSSSSYVFCFASNCLIAGFCCSRIVTLATYFTNIWQQLHSLAWYMSYIFRLASCLMAASGSLCVSASLVIVPWLGACDKRTWSPPRCHIATHEHYPNIHTYIHACMHAYIHIYIHTSIHAIHTIHTYIPYHTIPYHTIPSCTHTYIHTIPYKHTYIHARIHTYIRTYIHARIHTYIHSCPKEAQSRSGHERQ